MATNILLVGAADPALPGRIAGLDPAFSVEAVTPEAAPERLATGGVDCVVVADGQDLPGTLSRVATAAPSVPRLVVDEGGLDAGAAVEAGATDVVPLAEPRLFVQRVHTALGAPADAAATTRIRRLHEVAAALDDVESVEAAYDLVVEAAKDILAFDICYVGVVEDDGIHPKAATRDPLLEDPKIFGVDEGVAGRTIRTGETFVVDDAAADPDAAPVDEGYRSALSVPIGDWGVFQAVATETDAFSAADRSLAELLVSHLASAVERVRYEAALQAERDRFAALFENVPDPIVRYRFEDGRPTFEAVNPAFERVFGYDAEAVIGEDIDAVLVPEDARNRARDLNESVRDGDRLDAEVERLTADGPRTFLVRNAPFATTEGTRGWAIYADVEALKRRERELQRQNDRLESFAGVVSHDLRSPLNVATGNLELVRERVEDEALDDALDALERMDQLIDDLLTLARNGQVVEEPTPTDVSEVARDAWWTVQAPEATLRVGAPPTVGADADRLRELFENLFRNAVDHAGDAVTVEVDGFEGGFYVADDGPGIPADERETVFDPGVTTHPEGTGLGLSIVEEIAAAHGWRVAATDSEAGGARFEVHVGGR